MFLTVCFVFGDLVFRIRISGIALPVGPAPDFDPVRGLLYFSVWFGGTNAGYENDAIDRDGWYPPAHPKVAQQFAVTDTTGRSNTFIQCRAAGAVCIETDERVDSVTTAATTIEASDCH